MNRLLLFILSAAFLLPSLRAQTTPLVATRVYATQPGVLFYVDEQSVLGSQTFLWPVGSKHRLRFVGLQTSGVDNTGGSGGDTQYTLTGWTDNVGAVYGVQPDSSTADVWVTAQSSINFFRANVAVAYLVKIRTAACNFNDATQICVPIDPNSPGYVVLDGGTIISVDTNMYMPAGSVHTWQAMPNPGNVFTGWSTPVGQNMAFHVSFAINYPITMQAHWSPAKTVSFNTDPSGLKVRIDQTSISTPYAYDFAPGTNHTLGADSPQLDKNGQNWVFTGWSNGGGQNASYTVAANAYGTDSLTANFAPASVVTFQTDPPGLQLTVNGRSNWPSLSFVGTVGASYDVSAPAEQTDALGRKYTFAGWSNGGPASQTVTIQNVDAKNSMVLTAKYTAAGRVTITTNPPGLAVQVDGSNCSSPCTVDRATGTQVSISAVQSVPTGSDTRLDFTGWSDGGNLAHSFTFGSSPATLTANYQTTYRVSAGMSPAASGDVSVSPSSPDGFYAGGTQMTFTATARPGFRFHGWTGDMSSQSRIVAFPLSGPVSLQATFDKVAFVPDNGVTNAAGATPDGVVGFGSIMTISGVNLASDSFAGPASPLAQSLGGVMVQLSDRFLPLFAVTPNQITALAPADLPEGNYPVTVISAGNAPITTNMSLARNAPGLFTRQSGDNPVVNALHADGTQVDWSSPAVRGETITIFGTGFGPFTNPVPVGFAVPADQSYTLADSVDVLVADQVVSPVSVFATPGSVGLTSLQLQIADPLPTGTTVDLRIRINGRVSNTVQIPLQ